MAGVPPALSQGAGYGIVIGLSVAFALVMIGITWSLKKVNREVQTSEMFNTAGRSVKAGLIGSAVVSSWTWAATLLQSTTVCYKYGVSGPFWYASGATVQILLFATLAIEMKRRAPNAHTFLEVIRARFGTAGHIVFMVFGLITNILVSLMLYVGGSAVVNALTGMHTIAAIFILPAGVIAYTVVGGLKATILTDWANTFIMLVIIIIYGFEVYASNPLLGSPARVYELLVEAAARHPVDGNAGGSYLTMRSTDGIIFFVINIVGNFGTVFLDNGYWNKAIAASPVDALPGYILGGLTWFAVPWLTATAMGLAALALETNAAFPTFPDRMDPNDVSAGLVLPYAAVALLGKGGAVAALIMVFTAVTSATSSELVAVSSICTYDIYRTYFKPNASGKSLIWMSHVAVASYSLFISAFSIGLWYGGISLGWLYLFMGVVISSAVLPATLTMLWKGLNKWAACLSPILGTCCSLIAWIVTAHKESGELTVDSLGANYPMLAGNVTALLSPAVFIPIFTLIFGMDDYDWQSMMNIKRGDDHDVAEAEGVNVEDTMGGHEETAAEFDEEQKKLLHASKISKIMTTVMTIILLVLWPIPMYGSGYIFSEGFFAGWASIALAWILISFLLVGVYPVWEGRVTIVRTIKGLLGKGDVITEGHEASPGDITPTEKSGAKGGVSAL
ncbi:uncharacterized protein MKZ38_003009 [Zalerion maritima]|uniref:Urea active transporter n=1 Tax=Zalerion maritima TaxID=339359 RepID=A0AAD5RN60_9PEZI|nr:uncharacterized protein MKZ38_003009 [Zalerion maritima]